MTTAQRRLDRGIEQATHIQDVAGAEIRLSRRGAGVSIRAAAASVGMSETMLGRIERGRLPNVTVRQLAIGCAAVGLKFAARPYLDGDPIRDSGHGRLLERLHRELPKGTHWGTEVALARRGDPRAWDAQCRLMGVTIAIEAEMRLSDLQAVDRRIALKRRDSGVAIVILLVADTRATDELSPLIVSHSVRAFRSTHGPSWQLSGTDGPRRRAGSSSSDGRPTPEPTEDAELDPAFGRRTPGTGAEVWCGGLPPSVRSPHARRRSQAGIRALAASTAGALARG